MSMWRNGFEFEDEVRRIARALWGTQDGDGSAQMVDGRERDCIFETEELTHYIECTRKRELAKVREDAKKMAKYREKQAKHGRLVKLWIATEHEPTPDQSSEARKNNIRILSLAQFERKVLDAHGYMELRRNYRFGSATNPDNDSADLSGTRYQPTAIRDRASNDSLDVAAIANLLQAGELGVLLGDYGMGKSITLREVFLELRKRKVKGKCRQTPVLYERRSCPPAVSDRRRSAIGVGSGSIRAFLCHGLMYTTHMMIEERP